MLKKKKETEQANSTPSTRISISISAKKYDAIYGLYIEKGLFRGWSDFCYSALRHFLITYSKISIDVLNDIDNEGLSGKRASGAFTEQQFLNMAQLERNMSMDYDVPPTKQIQITIWPEIENSLAKFSSNEDTIQMILRIAIHLYARYLEPEIKCMVEFQERYKKLQKESEEDMGTGSKDYISKWTSNNTDKS